MNITNREIVLESYIDPYGSNYWISGAKNISFYPEENHFVIKLFSKEMSFFLEGINNKTTRSTAQLTDVDGEIYRIDSLTMTVLPVNNKLSRAHYVFELSDNKKATIISKPFVL